jgi:hypothetical protein
LPTFLCACFLLQCGWFVTTQSIAVDEPLHVLAGLQAWRNHQFTLNLENPPLVRLLLSMPVVGYYPQVTKNLPFPGTDFRPTPEGWAWRVRSVNVFLGLILAVLLWVTTRNVFSEGAANVALGLFAFTPSLIANFSIATIDGGATLLMFAGAVQLVRWRQNPTWRETTLLGFALGLMLACKNYMPVMYLVALGCVLVAGADGTVIKPKNWNWRKAIFITLVAFVIVWAAYFFHISKVSFHANQVTVQYPNWDGSIIKPMRTLFNFTLYVPAAEHIRGLLRIVEHNQEGFQSFLLGQFSRGGWKLYYPFVILFKWPTVLLLLFLLGLFLTLRGRIPWPRWQLLMMAFPGLLFVLAVFSKFNIGERHILPLYPFAILIAAGCWEFLRARRFAMVIVVTALLLNAADCLRYAPDYLSFFNVFVNPQESYKLISDSNLDWGEGLLALRDYEKTHPDEKTYLEYFGTVDPKIYGIRAEPLDHRRVSGTVICSATTLTGLYLHDREGCQWLLQYPRKTVLNHTLHVFIVPEAVSSTRR